MPAGVEARSVAANNDALIFRLQLAGDPKHGGARSNGHRAGVYRQQLGGAADTLELLAADSDGAILLEPQSAPTPTGDVVILKRSLPSGAPSATSEIVFARTGAPALVVEGQEVAVSANGAMAAVVDTSAGVSVVDLSGSALKARMLLPLALDDAQQAPVPALSPDGAWVFVTQEAALIAIDVASGEVRELLPAAPGVVGHSVAARSVDDLVVVVRSATSDGPRGELLHLTKAGRTSLWTAPLAQPAVAPVIVRDHVYAALTLEPFGSATYGPVVLVALPLAGGALAKVTELSSGALRLRTTGDELLIEGGDEVLCFSLRSVQASSSP